MTVRKPLTILITICLSLNAVFDDIRETAVFQRSAADQRTVHIRPAHQLAGVRWFDTATVLDSRAPGNCLVEHGRKLLADEGVRVLSLLRGRRLAGADGPDRFVGNDRFLHLLRGQSSQ